MDTTHRYARRRSVATRAARAFSDRQRALQAMASLQQDFVLPVRRCLARAEAWPPALEPGGFGRAYDSAQVESARDA